MTIIQQVAQRQGQIVSGVYQSASHRIVPVSDCLIENTVADEIIVTIRSLLKSFKIRPYDEDTGRGTLRHVLVRRGWRSGEILVVLVTAHGMPPGKRNFVRALLQRHPDITTIVQNINAGQTSLVLGPHSEVLYGPGYIREQLGDFTFRISPRAFYQINPVQTEVLYRTALEYAGLTGTETVVDAYCGTGTITLCLAREAGRAVGVEVVPQAIEDAKENAKRNGLADKTEFYCMDAGQAAQMFAAKGERPDVIVVDPPRKGVSADVIEAISAMAPQRVVYVSCDPATLARDLKLLTAAGYTLQTAEAFDLFPRCAHVETVVLLSRETNPLTVEVRMEVETGEVKEHPTYKRIQEYVQEKYGFKVHTAYIAEVKRMVGLDMHKAPNAVEQRKHEYHPCPPEKVEAIKDALRHFGLIAE